MLPNLESMAERACEGSLGNDFDDELSNGGFVGIEVLVWDIDFFLKIDKWLQ